jgi:hypothetical protein
MHEELALGVLEVWPHNPCFISISVGQNILVSERRHQLQEGNRQHDNIPTNPNFWMLFSQKLGVIFPKIGSYFSKNWELFFKSLNLKSADC